MKKRISDAIGKLRPAHLLTGWFLAFILFGSIPVIPEYLYHLGSAFYWKTGYVHFIETVNKQYEGMLTTEKNQPFLWNKGSYINLNGLMAKALRQPMMNNRVKLKNGHLASLVSTPVDPADIQEAADNIIGFRDSQTAAGGNFLFVLVSSQISKYEDLLPVGYVDTTNATADTFLTHLEQAGVPYLDLREELQEDGLTVTESYYTTDHHWKPQTGLWAYGKILEKLTQTGAIPPVDPSFTDPVNFTFETYEDTFLGSSGKRTGRYFAGLDDSILIRPNFRTDISIAVPERNLKLRGCYEDVCYNTEAVHNYKDPDFFQENCYGLYGWGDTQITHWRNESAPIQGKFLLIGESFGNIPFSLMSIVCESCDEVDLRYYDGDFASHYASYAPDTVIVQVNVDMVLSEFTDISWQD